MDEHNKFWKSSGSKGNMFIHSRYENTKIINGEIKSSLKEYYLMPECVEECLKEVLKHLNIIIIYVRLFHYRNIF